VVGLTQNESQHERKFNEICRSIDAYVKNAENIERVMMRKMANKQKKQDP